MIYLSLMCLQFHIWSYHVVKPNNKPCHELTIWGSFYITPKNRVYPINPNWVWFSQYLHWCIYIYNYI